jgi:tripartite-type tricarboxylate transporter receptor subunit TctC
MRLVAWGVMLFAMLGAASAAELKIIVHTATGGHYTHAVIVAKHLPKYLPNTKLSITTMQGASGIVALNYLANVSPKDGSEIATVHTRAILSGLFQTKEVKYNVNEFNWIGSALDGRKQPFLMLTRSDRSKVIGGLEASTDINQFKVIKHLTGLEFDEVSGYKDAQDVKLAFDRGEVTAVIRSLDGIRFAAPDWLTNPNVKPALQFGNGKVRHPSMPDVPTLEELSISNADLEMLRLFEAYTILARAFVAPPGTDPARLAELREAFWSVFNDTEYRADVAKFGVEVSPIDWEQCHKTINAIMSSSSNTMKKLQGF